MIAAIRGSDWSEKEVDLTVESYFELLAMELSGQKFNKALLYRKLAEQTGRTASSIEFKFQNISAVLDALGREWLRGLAPLANYQEMCLYLLANKVANHIEALDLLPFKQIAMATSGVLQEPAAFYLEPAPELNRSAPELPQYLKQLVQKFDPVTRDAKNRAIGEAGEAYIFEFEKRYLNMIDRSDLAKQVRWVAREEGDGAGFDILSFSAKGEKKFVEVKTTVGGNRTPFFVSRNELEFCRREADNYSLVRLFDFRKSVRGFELKGLLEQHVKLSTENYRAEFS